MDCSFYSLSELRDIGFKSLGSNVSVSRASCILGAQNISIGDNSRIDAFSVLSASDGYIEIGTNVHVASYVSLMGKGGVVLENFSGLSQGVRIFSASDDYSGDFMTNPTVGSEFTNVHSAEVTVEQHVIIGANSVVLPGVRIEIGAAIGAQSLVVKSLGAWGIYSGSPARFVKPRSSGLLSYQKKNSSNSI